MKIMKINRLTIMAIHVMHIFKRIFFRMPRAFHFCHALQVCSVLSSTASVLAVHLTNGDGCKSKEPTSSTEVLWTISIFIIRFEFTCASNKNWNNNNFDRPMYLIIIIIGKSGTGHRHRERTRKRLRRKFLSIFSDYSEISVCPNHSLEQVPFYSEARAASIN